MSTPFELLLDHVLPIVLQLIHQQAEATFFPRWSIRSLCLVSKHFFRLARPFLWLKVTLRTPNAFSDFNNLLKANDSDLPAGWVRKLETRFRMWDRDEPAVQTRELGEILARLKNLRHLVIFCDIGNIPQQLALDVSQRLGRILRDSPVHSFQSMVTRLEGYPVALMQSLTTWTHLREIDLFGLDLPSLSSPEFEFPFSLHAVNLRVTNLSDSSLLFLSKHPLRSLRLLWCEGFTSSALLNALEASSPTLEIFNIEFRKGKPLHSSVLEGGLHDALLPTLAKCTKLSSLSLSDYPHRLQSSIFSILPLEVTSLRTDGVYLESASQLLDIVRRRERMMCFGMVHLPIQEDSLLDGPETDDLVELCKLCLGQGKNVRIFLRDEKTPLKMDGFLKAVENFKRTTFAVPTFTQVDTADLA
ncbi:hypothetical protein BT69DRAFT_1333022 [Atractiella rhizophila]|nr:hypothetical protein BT69DRAFT_1333022 [Atractiella rhizophila]